MSEPDGTHEKPETPLPVEKDWLVQVINEKCAGACGVLKGYQCEIIGEGKGFLSYVTRVTLDWDPKSKGLSELPKAVIIKKPTMDKIEQMGGAMADMVTPENLVKFHNQECNVYEYLNLKSPPPIAIAKHFHLKKAHDVSDFGVLILEDLSDVGVSLGFEDNANLDQVMHFTENVAKLQAYGFNQGRTSKYFAEEAENPFADLFDELEKNIDTVRADFPGKVPHSSEYYRTLLQGSQEKLAMFACPTKFGFTPVISLGDVQPNNILWRRSKSDAAVAGNTIAAFIDFQVAHMGNCMSDIVYIMTNSLPTATRQKHQDAVLDHYLLVLAKETGGKCPITRKEALKIRRLLYIQFGLMQLSTIPMVNQMKQVINVSDELVMEHLSRSLDLLEEAAAE